MSRVPVLVVWMILAIVAVGGLAYWDERREARAVLDEVAGDQRWLAESLARAFGEHLASLSREAHDLGTGLADGSRSAEGITVTVQTASRPFVPRMTDHGLAFRVTLGSDKTLSSLATLARVFAPLRAFERPNDTLVLVRGPGESRTRSSSGSFVPLDVFDLRSDAARLGRSDAVKLGLPPRMALTGVATVEVPSMGTWRVAVVATAQTEREREERARLRLLSSVTLAVTLIVAFGGAALRRRTRELRLQHELELSGLVNERDESLRRADKLATLTALAMGIAHEVSTPLGVIIARAEQILARSAGDPRARRAGEVILVESQRINEVLRGLLSMVRGDEPQLERRGPSDVVGGAVDLVRHRFLRARVDLHVEIDDDAPDVACDGRLFEQVLVNLLLNACDASGDGGEVLLEVVTRDEAVAFIVTDSGSGMAAGDRDRAVEPFFTTKPEGTGLGLAIANEIVKQHRGTLVIEEREDGPGTRVVVELPIAGRSISPTRRSSGSLRS